MKINENEEMKKQNDNKTGFGANVAMGIHAVDSKPSPHWLTLLSKTN